MTQIAPFEFTLASGARITITHPGSWVTVTKGDYPFNIATDKGSNAEIERGLGVQLDAFKQLYIHNTSDYSQTIQIYIGDAYVRDSRLSVPSGTTVGIVDGSVQRVSEGNSFIASIGTNASATNYVHHQILNPVGSGKVMLLRKLLVADLTGAGVVRIYDYGTALSTQEPDAKNKRLGQSLDTSGELYKQSTASILPSTAIMFLDVPAASTLQEIPLEDPFQIDEGQGICIVCGTVNHGLRSVFQYTME